MNLCTCPQGRCLGVWLALLCMNSQLGNPKARWCLQGSTGSIECRPASMSCQCNGSLMGITCKLSDSVNLESIHQDIKLEVKLSSGSSNLGGMFGMQFKIDQGYIYQRHNQQRSLSCTPFQLDSQGRTPYCSQSIAQSGTPTDWLYYLG